MNAGSESLKSPLVMCLTNTVAANFTANVLLAIGAKPAMMEEPSEAAELASVADAVLVNVGTLTPAQAEVMRAAVRACNAGSGPEGAVSCNAWSCPVGAAMPRRVIPWVLDPVACQAVSYRRAFVRELLAQNPTALRGNHAEINFLMGNLQSAICTADNNPPAGNLQSEICPADNNPPAGNLQSEICPADNNPPAGNLQSEICNLKSIWSLSTGEVDVIRRGSEEVSRVTGGVPMLQRVTATGCAQGAVVAAFLGWGQPPEQALLSASQLMKRAGARAWGKAKAPGSFQIALLDAFAELAPEFVNGGD